MARIHSPPADPRGLVSVASQDHPIQPHQTLAGVVVDRSALLRGWVPARFRSARPVELGALCRRIEQSSKRVIGPVQRQAE
jgi:hypothetical protein